MAPIDTVKKIIVGKTVLFQFEICPEMLSFRFFQILKKAAFLRT